MPTMHAQVTTEHASRYIARLCKHFAHKVPATWSDAQGTADFPFGRCIMKASGTQLALHCSATDAAALERVCWVVADHLERFSAAVEAGEPLNVHWRGA